MKPTVAVLRDGRLRGALLPTLASGLAAAGLLGVTARGVASGAAALELERARELVEEREERELALAALAPAWRPQDVEALTASLRGLIPDALGRVEAFDLVREAASRAGVRLSALEMEDELDLGLVLEERTVVELRLHVVGEGSLDAFVRLVDGLRAAGAPTAVEEFRVSRGDALATAFRIDARLGVFHYAAPAAAAEPADDEGT